MPLMTTHNWFFCSVLMALIFQPFKLNFRYIMDKVLKVLNCCQYLLCYYTVRPTQPPQTLSSIRSKAEHLYLLDWCEPPFTFGTLCLRAVRHSSRQRLPKLAFNTLLISQNLIFRLSTLAARHESQAIIWQNINIKEDDRSYKGRDKGQTLLFSFLLNYLFSISSIYLLRSRPALHNVDFYAPNRLLWWISRGSYLPLIDST